MPHISKRKLSDADLARLHKELVKSFERSFKNLKTKSVFDEFFTDTEKIMFAKRLAVIAMLKEEVSTYMIAESLGMSPSTTARMSLNFELGKYDHVIKEALGKKDIWEIINRILFVGGIMPPIAGRKRWRSLDKALYKKKLNKN